MTVHRLRLWYYFQRARVECWYGFNINNALYFMKLALLFLCGRLLLVTTEKPVSNGGYRYFALVISKRPLSSDHTYEDL